MAKDKPSLLLPLLIVAVGFAFWLGRQSVDEINSRPWHVYAIMAGLMAVSAVAVWGAQRLHGKQWPVVAQFVVMLGMIAGLAWLSGYVFAPEPPAPPSFDAVMEQRAAEAVHRAENAMNLTLDYSPGSLPKVEKILTKLNIQHMEKPFSDERLRGESMLWGAYVGEVLRRHKGGHWEPDSEAAGEGSFPLHWEGHESFPCAWCYKRIANGPEDNVWLKYLALTSEDLPEGVTFDGPKP